jgi:hypothetical protein
MPAEIIVNINMSHVYDNIPACFIVYSETKFDVLNSIFTYKAQLPYYFKFFWK